jgi:hypothetical protein
VLYRLQVLIWSNRISGVCALIITILLAAIEQVRREGAAYLLPILSMLITTIILLRLWSLNWNVKGAPAANPAGVGQTPGPLEGAALPRLTPLGQVNHTLQGLSSFKLRLARDPPQPSMALNDRVALGSFRTNHTNNGLGLHVKKPSISLSSHSSIN